MVPEGSNQILKENTHTHTITFPLVRTYSTPCQLQPCTLKLCKTANTTLVK